MGLQRLITEARRLVEASVYLHGPIEPGQWFRQELRDHLIYFRADVLLKNKNWKGKYVEWWDGVKAVGGKQTSLHPFDLRLYRQVETHEVPPKVVAKAGEPLTK